VTGRCDSAGRVGAEVSVRVQANMNLRVVVRHVAAAPKPGSRQAIDRATHVNGLLGGESCDVCADIQLEARPFCGDRTPLLAM
jgi:hypothetical protein